MVVIRYHLCFLSKNKVSEIVIKHTRAHTHTHIYIYINQTIMGSTDKAVITGFICRLCSKMNRFVIHIYGEEGERMRLAEKINAYLPITVNINDPLPKTACLHCIERLEAHHELMEQFMFARRRLVAENNKTTNTVATSPPTTSSTTTTQQSSVVETMPAPSSPPC